MRDGQGASVRTSASMASDSELSEAWLRCSIYLPFSSSADIVVSAKLFRICIEQTLMKGQAEYIYITLAQVHQHGLIQHTVTPVHGKEAHKSKPSVHGCRLALHS